MEITEKLFGELPDGREVMLYTLKNDKGMEVDITNYGGIVTSIRVPDKDKKPGDVVLGFDNLEGYLNEHPYFGALIGRYGNRIKDGKFSLEGKDYTLAVNNGPNALHGGLLGFDKVLWTAAKEKTLDFVSLKLAYESKDMEEGYPGNLLVEVVYTVNDSNELVISYRANTDKTTVINLTNHSYFNLNNCEGTVLDHELMIDADKITEVDENGTPSGELPDVEGTPFDFRTAKTIGRDIADTDNGYDHNYVLNNWDKELRRIASVHHEGTGRTMDVLTTEPGVQLYTGNFLDGTLIGKGGIAYPRQASFCLETQHFPDSPNNPHFPSTVLKPGEEYEQVTIYRFKW